MVSESLSGTGSEYYIRARAAEQLLDKGRKDDALKLVDETMANFAEHRSDPQAIEGYANFVGELVNIDPDRFLSALAQLAGSETVAPGYGGSLKIGNRIIQLTYSEAQILGVISSTERRPEITLKAINSLPELKSKLDQIGGIDGYLTPGRSAGRVELSVTSPKGLAAGSRMSGEDDEAGTRDIYADLHGKARKNPWYVQAKLSEIGRDPDAISKLISLAQRAIHEEPELSDLALEAAIPLISKVQPLQKRAESLMNLITAYTEFLQLLTFKWILPVADSQPRRNQPPTLFRAISASFR